MELKLGALTGFPIFKRNAIYESMVQKLQFRQILKSRLRIFGRNTPMFLQNGLGIIKITNDVIQKLTPPTISIHNSYVNLVLCIKILRYQDLIFFTLLIQTPLQLKLNEVSLAFILPSKPLWLLVPTRLQTMQYPVPPTISKQAMRESQCREKSTSASDTEPRALNS